jgi:hypothetical protein
MKRTSLLATAIALAVAGAGPNVQAQDNQLSSEVRVGIIDVSAKALTFEDKNTRIWYREFTEEGKLAANWQTESGFDHGKIVASAFVRQLREIDKEAKILIFAANAFQENESSVGSAIYSRGGASKRTLSVNWKGASEALRWFKESGVTTVLTAFVGKDTREMRAFVAEATSLGMTVIAGAGNADVGKVFPAAYPEVISVAADNKGLAFAKDASIASWVDFTSDGNVPLDKKGPTIDQGSSFSSAKLAAYAAYFKALHSSATTDQVRDIIRKSSVVTNYSINGQNVQALRVTKDSSSQIKNYAFQALVPPTEQATIFSSSKGLKVAQAENLASIASPGIER